MQSFDWQCKSCCSLSSQILKKKCREVGGILMKIKLKSSLHGKLIVMTVIPLLILGMFITIYSTWKLTSILQAEVKDKLEDLCVLLGQRYDARMPGDYVLNIKNGTEMYLTKGGRDISEAYDIMDGMQEQTGIDFSIFFYDTRMATTLRDQNGERIVGTAVNSKVLEEVYQEKEEHFYTGVDVHGISYFAYYRPLYNEDGTCIGMIFAGKPAQKIEAMIYKAVLPILFTVAAAVLLTAFFCLRFASRLVNSIGKIERFLTNVAKGEFTESMSMDILARSDELGNMAHSAVQMQKNLRDMVDKDALTGLYNRRYGNLHLPKMMERTIRKERVFTVALGDIDFFKKVNDTYGHEAGDEVLKNVAGCLTEAVQGKGTAIRWGGEEFLLVFETEDAAEAMERLQGTREKIRSIKTVRGENTICVTMTFGVMQLRKEMDTGELLKQADEKLYYGKENGRDRIVTAMRGGQP